MPANAANAANALPGPSAKMSQAEIRAAALAAAKAVALRANAAARKAKAAARSAPVGQLPYAVQPGAGLGVHRRAAGKAAAASRNAAAAQELLDRLVAKAAGAATGN